MVRPTREITNWARKMGKDYLHGMMEQLITGSFATIISMALVNTFGRINGNIKEIGNSIKCMARENSYGQMGKNMSVNN